MNHTTFPKGKNHLKKASSPYLLQHKANPVHWFEWGEKAFKEASAQNKLIFLSVGYSSCHWCHVMAHESFEDDNVAHILNDSFISIKVDREERPDIDGVYMTVCQLMSGRGGWPLSVILTPQKKPVFAGTYIPKTGRYGSAGFIDVLTSLSRLWSDDSEKIEAMASEITKALEQIARGGTQTSVVTQGLVDEAFENLETSFDDVYGGFGQYQKFPSPHNILFLLDYFEKNQNQRALEMAEKTLCSISKGGMRDHLGGGYHRYSTDREWLVPHFEKMLYDQATIALASMKAYGVTGKDRYVETGVCALDYIIHSLKDSSGGFHSSEDADSEGSEGKYYLWSTDEILRILNDEEYEVVSDHFNLARGGNYRDESTGQKTGLNILHRLSVPFSQWRESSVVQAEDPGSTRRILSQAIEKLREQRSLRISPGRDDKVLADWNGLAIAALAVGGKVLGDSAYIEQAREAAHFIFSSMTTSGNRLFHRFRNGAAGIPAFLDDYAFVSWGLIELYNGTGEEEYLKRACGYMDVLDLFFDSTRGGFYFIPSDGEKLIARLKEGHDGPYPSGNSVAAHNCSKLWKITGDSKYLEHAQRIVESFGPIISRAPAAHIHLLNLFLYLPEAKKEHPPVY